MLRAVQTLFHDWLRLLYWAFFKPTALRAHLRQIAPELPEKPYHLRETWRALRVNSALRVFWFNALVVTVLTPFVLDIAVGLVITVVGGDFDWVSSFSNAVFGVLLGVAGGVALGVVVSVAFGVVVGVAFGVAFSMGIGVAYGVAGSVTVGVAYGMTITLAGSVAAGTAVGMALGVGLGVFSGMAGGTAVGVASSLGFCMGYGIMYSMTYGMSVGVSVGVASGMAGSAGGLRMPFYIFEILPTLRAYRRARHGENIGQYLTRSPVYFDDFLVLPQPYLSSFLLLIARSNLHDGLQHIAHIAGNPFQRWATQRTLRMLLERDNVPFFLLADTLLTAPEPYVAVGNSREEHERAADRYFTSKLLLAELVGVPPVPGVSDAFARVFTAWLRMRGKSPYAPLAKAYLDLMNNAAQPADVLPVFDSARTFAHGEEIYQSFRIVDAALQCENLAQIARCKREFAPLFAIESPLRPNIVNVFRCLEDAATDATASLTAEHPTTRGDALLKAQGVLEEARRAAENIYEPERHILLGVIEQWRQIFVAEGARVAERVPVAVLPNPYVAGRALSPADGKLFVGRHDEFRQIEETLKTGVTIVLYGQRRIGKTSILLHLAEHLSHNLLPIYLNLQRIQVETTAGLLHRSAEEIAARLRQTHWHAPALPALDAFRAEPFLAFDAFLRDVEGGLQTDQRVVLVFDEFEELEQQVKRGHIDNRIFAFMRGVTQTGRGFAIVFAGLHTLEQVSRDYWHPFFLSVKPIKVNYLLETDARQLITDPIVRFPLEYESQATERIIAVTHGQPYLVQDLCHNLVTHLNAPLHRSNRATVEDVNAVLERTLESGTYYFDDYVWGRSNDDERLTMAAIAEAAYTRGYVGAPFQVSRSPGARFIGRIADEGWVEFAIAEKYLGRERALAALKTLCARDILEEHASGEMLEYRFQVELSRLWVARTKPLARILLERGK
jgi:hypothetical protein